MQEIIRFDKVSYSYEDGTPALKDCSTSLYAGETVAVLGNNGAGKSTFFLLCNGVLHPDAGQIFFQGRPIGKRRKELNLLRRHVGLVFQDPDVQILGGTVEEEVSFGPMNLGLPEEQVRERVDCALKNLKLEAFCQRAPQYLSGGEKKQVSIADILAMEPQLMLLDEPAASLDPANSRLLEENLAMLKQRGIALVIATHNVDFAWRWASRVLLFHDGVLMADTTPEEAFADQHLLDVCGLEQPTLYRVSRLLGFAQPARTMAQLEQQAAEKISHL